MTLSDLEERLRGALRRPLPGAEAHALLAPRPRPGWRPGRLPEESRAGAGLLLFYPMEERPHLVLTVRTKHLPAHRGQVSLPGGAVEESESIEEAALREAREEIGVDPSRVHVLGALSPLHIPASGYVLHPVVGVAGERPAFAPALEEVARILEIPLSEVEDKAKLRTETRVLRGMTCIVPYFDLGGEKVWGATAMVLAELLCLL